MDSNFYDNLQAKLENEDWPTVYMFKFIVPSDNQHIALVQALFGPEAQVTLRSSRNGKYTSVTGKEMMLGAEEVIARYKKAESIDGLISL